MATVLLLGNLFVGRISAWWTSTHLHAGIPGVSPNSNGLPGLTVLQQMVGAGACPGPPDTMGVVIMPRIRLGCEVLRTRRGEHPEAGVPAAGVVPSLDPLGDR